MTPIVSQFPPGIIKVWEEEICLHFSIALVRITGWLLHIDWIVENGHPDMGSDFDGQKRFPLRVYVGNNNDDIFDVRGVTEIIEFSSRIISPLAQNLATKKGLTSPGVVTRFYSEEELEKKSNLKIDNKKLARAENAILSNSYFLDKISRRSKDSLPAHLAAKFSLGRCAPFAKALEEFTKKPAVAIVATKFKPYLMNSPGYIHSLVLHEKNIGEDAWGISNIDEIANRFGAVEYYLDEVCHDQIVKNQERNSKFLFDEAYQEAFKLIQIYK